MGKIWSGPSKDMSTNFSESTIFVIKLFKLNDLIPLLILP